jgi:hypothetical protein
MLSGRMLADWAICADVEDPKLMLIIGCIGLGLNVICAMFLHGMLICRLRFQVGYELG